MARVCCRARDAVEVTHTQSPNRFREFIGGLRDGGEVAPTLALLPGDASYAALVADYKSDAPVNYRVVLPQPRGDRLDVPGATHEP